jgi:AAA+ ATPase superfamily predicted ATPase
MIRDISSPFTPGVPVPAEFFVGRMAEVERLRAKVATATQGRLQVAFLTGERGIGKSSLASLVRFRAEREYQALGLHIFLGGATSLEEMVQRIFDRLLKESAGTSWFDSIKQLFGSRIHQIDLFGIGVEFAAESQDLTRLVHNFAPALRNLTDRLKGARKGILLVLDDINGLAASAAFANWLKSLVDEIATSQKPLPLFLLLVGTEERRQESIRLQPSLARVFDVVEIRAWTEEETRAFFERAFASVGIEVEEGALHLLATYTGGLPVLAQEIGDAAFHLDDDNRISVADAMQAVMQAADIVGHKHLEPQVFQALRSARYRAILRKVVAEGQSLQFHFLRAEVMERLSQDERKVFDNFLRRMEKLGVLVRDAERGPGAYRFTNLLHYLYFTLEAARAGDRAT